MVLFCHEPGNSDLLLCERPLADCSLSPPLLLRPRRVNGLEICLSEGVFWEGFLWEVDRYRDGGGIPWGSPGSPHGRVDLR